MTLSAFVKEKRNAAGLTQPECADKAGVGLRFLRELEQGKETLKMDKVNQVLQLFGSELGPVNIKREQSTDVEKTAVPLRRKELKTKVNKKRK